MIDLDTLCAELNVSLPAAGWRLRHPLRSLMPRDGARYASASWSDPSGRGLTLQLHARERSPVLIVWETDYSCGTAEPHEPTVENVVASIREFEWLITAEDRR